MSRDLLDEAVRALRDTTAEEAEAGQRFTRARVMADLHQGRVRRRTRLAFVLPLAASFVAASAWGVSSGKARVILQEIGASIGVVDPPPADPPAETSRPAAARRQAPRPEAVTSPVEATPPPPVQEEEEAEPEPAEPAKPQRPAPSAASAQPEADPELDLYRTAHRAHFVQRDSGAALRAWDAYLSENPSGRFVLEARYNRALCLVRLGRSAEARSALEPFARGAFGAYRQREAKELIERLPE